MGKRATRNCSESESLELEISESSDTSESVLISDARDMVLFRGTGELLLFNRPKVSKTGSPFDLALFFTTNVSRSDLTFSSLGGKKHASFPFAENRAPQNLGR